MKRVKWILSSVLILTLVMGLLAGCGGSSDSSDEEKDSLVFSINADIVTMDCHFARDTVTSLVHYQVYDMLIYNEGDNELEPGLAESWEFNDNNTEITFKIREDVLFHNGDMMTAEDVAFSLNRAIESPFTASYTGTMDRAEVVDDTHVRLYMKQAFGPVIQCLSVPCLGIVSKRAVEEMGDEGFAAAPVGTGAYKFVSWRSGEKIVLEAFDDYYKGEPAIKDVTFSIMTNKSTAAIALDNKEVDVLYAPAVEDQDYLDGLDHIQVLTSEGSVYMWVIAFNNTSNLFSNEKLREAISYAINRNEIVEGALDGKGEAVEMPIVPSLFGYDPSFKNNEYDLDKAKSLLAEAGYPDGLKMTMKLNQSSTYTQPAEIVQSQLRKIGIDVQFELMERAAFLADVTTDADYDVTLFMFTAGYLDPDYVLYGRMHSSNIGSTNYCNYSNPDVDRMLDQARSSSDEEERADLYYRISEHVRDEAPFIPLMTDNCCIAADSKLSGVKANSKEAHIVFNYNWEI
jgi:peptide/nickel transport system substrate-binding protein